MIHTAPLLSAARGDAPVDLVLRSGRIVNVFTGEIETGDIAIAEQVIVGIGEYPNAKSVVDLNGAFVSPGLIDAHVHIESSLCLPAEFARAVVPRGVTTVVADPHEIANVMGVEGIRFIAEASRELPLEVILMGSSCVPATNMAHSGGAISASDLQNLQRQKIIHGLAEVMNYPGVIAGDPQMLAKISAMQGTPIDGHGPGLSGHALNAYVLAGVGSDHECVSPDEAKEKLSRGMYLLIREATGARNLEALLPVVTPKNSRRVCFCTDDRTAGDLLREGSIDHMVCRAIAFGIDPIEAIRMATLNTCEWFGLHHIGAIAPGRLANLMIFDDLKNPVARMVYSHGTLCRGEPRVRPGSTTKSAPLPVDVDKISLEIRAKSKRMRVIGAMPDQLMTEHRIMDCEAASGFVHADVARDILKMAVIERHGGAGTVGLGFIQGFGLKKGAIAGTVAHDHHNLVCIGAEDAVMMSAVRAVVAMGGGLAVCAGETILAQLPLPVGGLMSDRPIEDVAREYESLVRAAREILGSPLADPFMAMSFMALEVIPSLKLTDMGLVDVEKFEIVDLFV